MFMWLLTINRISISRRDAEDFFLSPILTLAMKISQLSRNLCEIYFSCWVQWKWQTSPAQLKYSYDSEILVVPCVIGEVFALVGCYAAYICCLPTFWGQPVGLIFISPETFLNVCQRSLPSKSVGRRRHSRKLYGSGISLHCRVLCCKQWNILIPRYFNCRLATCEALCLPNRCQVESRNESISWHYNVSFNMPLCCEFRGCTSRQIRGTRHVWT